MIYLINKDTKEILQVFTEILSWDTYFVEYLNKGCRAKIYSADNEYFTDEEIDN